MQPESASFARWKEAHLRATHAEEHFYGQLCSNGIGLLEEQVRVCELRRDATAALLSMLCDMTERASNVRSTALESAAALEWLLHLAAWRARRSKRKCGQQLDLIVRLRRRIRSVEDHRDQGEVADDSREVEHALLAESATTDSYVVWHALRVQEMAYEVVHLRLGLRHRLWSVSLEQRTDRLAAGAGGERQRWN